ncbi:hypothetical protein [Methylomonas sp. AM2-LC]|uniref:hypothetical protein n=1 Tax=Methylomonas sp. AM2-LC TaxID=3153301 RepID=UPI003265A40C
MDIKSQYKFPIWAPTALVDEFRSLKLLASDCESGAYRFDNIDIDIDDFLSYINTANDMADILFNLLTNPDMEAAWRALDRHPQKPRDICPSSGSSYYNELKWFANHGGYTDNSSKGALAIWRCTELAIREFSTKILIAKTPAERRRKLTSIIDNAEVLLANIEEDDFAKNINATLVEKYLSQKFIENQTTNEIKLSPLEILFNHAGSPSLKNDISEARNAMREIINHEVDSKLKENKDYQKFLANTSDENFNSIETPQEINDFEAELTEFEDNFYNRPWNENPLIYRLVYWVSVAKNINTSELLRFLIDCVQHEANTELEIKQPNRGETLKKAFLIRRLSDHMMWLYGQPLDDVVARIVSVIIGIPLSRDDVKPYRLGNKNSRIN